MESLQDANSLIIAEPMALLQLLHLGDSALPIGATAHSFGLETLIAEAGVDAVDLPVFFQDWVENQGHTEAAFCLWAHGIKRDADWRTLNEQISSFKPARESREASLRLGKRFLALSEGLIGKSICQMREGPDVHLSAAFGRVGAALKIDAGSTAATYLHQAIFGAISVCQRLLPFGQTDAMRLLWSLKPALQRVVQRAKQASVEDLWTTQPMLEIASMRHPQLTTRLFIS